MQLARLREKYTDFIGKVKFNFVSPSDPNGLRSFYKESNSQTQRQQLRDEIRRSDIYDDEFFKEVSKKIEKHSSQYLKLLIFQITTTLLAYTSIYSAVEKITIANTSISFNKNSLFIIFLINSFASILIFIRGREISDMEMILEENNSLKSKANPTKSKEILDIQIPGYRPRFLPFLGLRKNTSLHGWNYRISDFFSKIFTISTYSVFIFFALFVFYISIYMTFEIVKNGSTTQAVISIILQIAMASLYISSYISRDFPFMRCDFTYVVKLNKMNDDFPSDYYVNLEEIKARKKYFSGEAD